MCVRQRLLAHHSPTFMEFKSLGREKIQTTILNLMTDDDAGSRSRGEAKPSSDHSHITSLHSTMTLKRWGLIAAITLLAAASCVTGFATIQPKTLVRTNQVKQIHPMSSRLQTTKRKNNDNVSSYDTWSWLGTAAAPLTLFAALPAEAADGGFVLASAFAAYVHYASLLTIVGVLVTERLLVKPNMSFDEEELLWKVDALYGTAGLALTVSGYYRAVEYGKGW